MQKDLFVNRHIGPSESDIKEMVTDLGLTSLDELINQIIPSSIRLKEDLKLDSSLSESEYLSKIEAQVSKNKIYRSFIGMGYYPSVLPAAILRNVFENPGWYTSYTPYQAEISQGRLEALLNFQTLVTQLTGMDISNCSLLDEGTAAAEAMSMMLSSRTRQAQKENRNFLFVDEDVFPQTIDVIKMRAEPVNVKVVVGNFNDFTLTSQYFGAILQYPSASGKLVDYSSFVAKAHSIDVLVTAVVDPMSLVLIKSPASWGADIAVGSMQRFGIPMGYGGPSAAFLACMDKFKRNMPGRIIGKSIDKYGNVALRMALQTREQHIKREKATSNICTAQALLAIMSGMYAVYHGANGLKRIANNIYNSANIIATELQNLGYVIKNKDFFDTVYVEILDKKKIEIIKNIAIEHKINFNYYYSSSIGISTHEQVSIDDINDIISIFAQADNKSYTKKDSFNYNFKISDFFARQDAILQQDVFNSYHSETELMRYIKKLENRDISLNRSMISLGSCTMKLNSAASMIPLSWSSLGNIHPFVPLDQAQGYQEIIAEVEKDLSIITGFAATSVQPNSGATGEHAGLMIIREYHKSRNQAHRNICIIPSSAHGTNPASAQMAGMEIVSVGCDDNGNINVEELKECAAQNKDNLSCIMITYPSTHGVFESRIIEIVDAVHANGGLVYMDGANMNAQVGLTNPGYIGADVCHLNLHKTFASPHGGGGPGIGSVSVAAHLVDFLPSHTIIKTGGKNAIRAITSSPYGSAMILPITYAYIKMMGAEALKQATKVAILNANYIASKLQGHYKVLYTGETGRCAHEMIIDLNNFKEDYGVNAGDIAHRLMDYGFHAPTLSFPVHETLMIEPTESESKEELDRFIETMIAIKQECEAIKEGKFDKIDNPIINAPHTQIECTATEWQHAYTREQAAFPLKWISENKFWPYVGKIDNGYGDRNLVCNCG